MAKDNDIKVLAAEDEGQTFSCIHCSYKTRIPFRLRLHMNKAHTDDVTGDIYKCQVCRRLFNTLRLLLTHQKKCQKNSSGGRVEDCLEKSIIKESASVSSPGPEVIKMDMKEENKKETMEARASVSPGSPPFLEGIFHALKVDGAGRGATFLCSKCSQRCPDVNFCAEHFQNSQCFTEEKSSTSTDNLVDTKVRGTQIQLRRLKRKSHVQGGQDSPQPKSSTICLSTSKRSTSKINAQCGKCDKTVTQKASLTLHMDTMHPCRHSFKCNLCDMSTAWKTALDGHILRKHLKLFRFQCCLCSFGTQSKQLYVSHMIKTEHQAASNTESGGYAERKIENQRGRCPICHLTMSNLGDLIEHTKTHTKTDLGSKKQHLSSPPVNSGVQFQKDSSGSDLKLKMNPRIILMNQSRNRISDSEVENSETGSVNNILEVDATNDILCELPATSNVQKCMAKNSLTNSTLTNLCSIEEKRPTVEGSAVTVPAFFFPYSAEIVAGVAAELAKLYPPNRKKDEREYKCNLCSVVCVDASALQSHQSRHR